MKNAETGLKFIKMAFDLSMEFIIPASPARVMELLTDAKLVRAWSGGEAVIEKKENGRFEMFDGWVYGKVLKATANELAYTWKTTDWTEDVQASEVVFKLSKDKEGTKVIVEHKGLPSQEEADSHKEGWEEYIFGPMEEYIWATTKK